MPANLPPQYYEAEKAYRAARTPQDKIEALEIMLAIMPKHKGTDHLRGELRSRIAKLSEESEKKQGGAKAQLYSARKEGAGQVALVGPPAAANPSSWPPSPTPRPKLPITPLRPSCPSRP